MYLPNKYTKWYNNIIKTAQTRTLPKETYVERHHYIPKSLGGTEVVSLTAREHFICHLLLTKMLTGKAKSKMIYAVWRMANSTKEQATLYKISSSQYQTLRIARKNAKMSSESKAKSSQTKKERKHPAWNKGVPRTKVEKENISISRKGQAAWNKDRPHPEKTLAKIAERARNRTVHTCPHCSKQATGSNYIRWHGDNCKLKP